MEINFDYYREIIATQSRQDILKAEFYDLIKEAENEIDSLNNIIKRIKME